MPTRELATPPAVDLVPDATPLYALTLVKAPEAVLAEAKKAAVALTTVLDARPRKVILGGERYLEYEDWSTVGRFYGASCPVFDVRYVEYMGGQVAGFSARARVTDASGATVSEAEADCLNDEPKWRGRPKYQTKKGVKVQIGEEPVPLYQLKSMAQTRAAAKALRMAFAWVVVLAGYRPTPAEEVMDLYPDEDPEPAGEPQREAPRAITPKRPAPQPPAPAPVPATPFPETEQPIQAAVVQAAPPAPPVPANQTGRITEVDVREVEGGALITLSTGLVGGTRNWDLINMAKGLQATGELVTVTIRPASQPGRAPTIKDMRISQ